MPASIASAQARPVDPPQTNDQQNEQPKQNADGDDQQQTGSEVRFIPRDERNSAPPRQVDADELFGPASGQPAQLDDAMMAIVERLDHPDYEARQQATDALHEARPTLAELRKLLSMDSLSAEQRNRVLLVTERKLLETPRGAVGIRMRPLLGDGPLREEVQQQIEEQGLQRQPVMMEVIDLLPNLPARKVLQITDRITHVDGALLTHRDQLVRYVQERRPGEEVQLTVQRVMRDENGNALRQPDGSLRYEEVTVPLTLGSADRLIDPETGAVDTRSPVYTERKAQADNIAELFGVRGQRLTMDGPPKRSQNVAVAMATDDENASAGAIENHQYIKQLRRDLEFIERGVLRVQQRRPAWESFLDEMDRQIRNLDLPVEDREYMKRVRERFREIVTTSGVLDR